MIDLDFVRRRAANVFDGGTVTANALASNIAFGAAVLGAGHVELTHDGDWWFVASEFDWLRAPSAHYSDRTELFDRMVPFPEQGPGSHRSEVYVTAFARRAYVVQDDAVWWVLGEQPASRSDLPHRDTVPPWCDNVLAFSFVGDAGA